MGLHPWVFRISSPSVLPCKTSYFLSRAGVKVVHSFCSMLEHSPIQHQACVLICSSLPMILGLLGTQWIQRIRSKTRGTSEPRFLWAICIPKFSQVCIFSRFDQRGSTFPTSLQPQGVCTHFPLCLPLPSVVCRERTSGSLGSVNCSF